MKKISLILMVVLLSAGLFLGCDLQIEDPWVPSELGQFQIGMANDAVNFDVTSIKLNNEVVSNDPKTISAGFLNNPASCAANVTTNGGDFVVEFVCSATSAASTQVYHPYLVVIQDLVNPGTYGWTVRSDAHGFDPLPSYPNVNYGTTVADVTTFDKGFTIKVTGTLDEIKVETIVDGNVVRTVVGTK